jgi:hypothetical protein
MPQCETVGTCAKAHTVTQRGAYILSCTPTLALHLGWLRLVLVFSCCPALLGELNDSKANKSCYSHITKETLKIHTVL